MSRTRKTYQNDDILEIKLNGHSFAEPKEYAAELLIFNNKSNDYVNQIIKVFLAFFFLKFVIICAGFWIGAATWQIILVRSALRKSFRKIFRS